MSHSTQSADLPVAGDGLRPLTDAGFWERVEALDDVIDGVIDSLRGDPRVDRIFYWATELGDWSLVWHLLAAFGAVRSRDLEGNAARVIAALGAESLLVNGLIKTLVGRKRPVAEFERPLNLRIPRTSSFPSGHASSATMAAILLAEKDPKFRLAYGAMAALVAGSRMYVRIHHASDVAGGIVTGAALARGVQALTRRFLPGF